MKIDAELFRFVVLITALVVQIFPQGSVNGIAVSAIFVFP